MKPVTRAILSLLLAVLPLGQFCMAAEEPPKDTPETLECRMLALVNAARKERDLPELKTDKILTEAARGHSREMAEKDYFSHRSPTPGRHEPLDRYAKAAGRRPTSYALAENIYKASSANVTGAHRALMESPGHRANLLDRKWEKIGIGIHVNDRGQLWVTQMFFAVPAE